MPGAVGDILAELGVVIVPRLESIAYEPSAGGRTEVARAAQVVMAYTFTDVDTGEEITAKVAGQGLDAGDKAPYKAMTGALKYALLQSFLLATGDDPEEERINHALRQRLRSSDNSPRKPASCACWSTRPRPNSSGCSPITRSTRWRRCAKAATGARSNCSIANAPNRARRSNAHAQD